MSQVAGLPNNSYKPITNTAWVHARLCKLQKGCTRLATASDKVYKLLDHVRWFSPGTPASSTTKTGRHDIAEILLKVALNTINQILCLQIIYIYMKLYKMLLYISSTICYVSSLFIFIYLTNLRFSSLYLMLTEVLLQRIYIPKM